MSHRSPRHVALVQAFLLCLALGLAACGRGTPSATDALPSPLSTQDTGTAGASATGTDPEASPSLPDGFPVPPGAVAQEPTPGSAAIAAWHTDASAAEVYAFLQDALPSAGFPIVASYPGDTVAVIVFAVAQGETLQVSLQGDADGTDLSVEPDATR